MERGVKPPKEQSPALPERSDSTQRPLVRALATGSTSHSSSPRPSTTASDSNETSSNSRPLGSTTRRITPSSTTSFARRAK
uniref:Uncharacterized protein n=1 Tax=Timema bartmani TaxID=61472 RepID=A0A7R9I8P7_9NEOP|nr:unnamed protein product [Timema bartmani]